MKAIYIPMSKAIKIDKKTCVLYKLLYESRSLVDAKTKLSSECGNIKTVLRQ